MQRLISNKLCINDQYSNDLTKEIDKYSLWSLGESYVLKDKINNKYFIRVPGMSTGKIEVDENDVIINVTINYTAVYTMKAYKEEVKDVVEKYIGMQLVFKE